MSDPEAQAAEKRLNRARSLARSVSYPEHLQQFTLDFLQDDVAEAGLDAPVNSKLCQKCNALAYRVETIVEVMDETLPDYHVMMVLLTLLDG
jgi:hypothetical protein